MTKKQEFEILKPQYLEAYKNANGKDVELAYARGWVIIDPDRAGTCVRVSDLVHLTEVLRNRVVKLPFKETFLDYEIVNSGNSDGFVVVKHGDDYQHCGNYSTLDDARDSALLYFMISRPEKFSSSIFHRMIGTKTYHEWYTLKDVVEEEGLTMPEGIYCSGAMNCTIGTRYTSFIQLQVWNKTNRTHLWK